MTDTTDTPSPVYGPVPGRPAHKGNMPNEERRQQVLSLYAQGLSMRAVARELGISFQAVHGLLVRMGATRRRRGGNQGQHSRRRK